MANEELSRPAILGAGSWGTALALILARREISVRLWCRNPLKADRIGATRFNDLLPGFRLPSSIQIEPNIASCISQADCIIFAVPSYAVRGIALEALPYLISDSCIVSTAKGLEENSLYRMSEVFIDVYKRGRVVSLSGPSFAREVAQELPTAVVAASLDIHLAKAVQQLFSGLRFRVYASSDICGVELGGVVKNVIAIAAGVCQGLELGYNAVAALITRGLAEMTRLAVALGAQPQTLAGLAGLGDLVLTCNGELSRNRQVGLQLASGINVDAITTGMTTVEGIRSTQSVFELAQRVNVTLPICEQMYAVLYGRRPPTEAIRNLMERSLRDE